MAKEKTESNHPTIAYAVETAFLHKAVMIDGKTESTLTAVKMPTIKQMGWTADFTAFVIVGKAKTHTLPSAALNHTILV